MAGDWIKVEHCTPRKPEVLRIARRLGVTLDDAFGKLVRLWIWFDESTVDGRVDGLVDADVDALVSCGGFAEALREVGWLVDGPEPGSVAVAKFDRHISQSAKTRAEKARRQQKWRERGANVDAHVDAARSTSAPPRERVRVREEDKETAIAVSCPQETCEPDDDGDSVQNESGEIFPLAGGRTWELPAQRLAEYDAAYQLDVRRELAKAREWLRDHPERRPRSGRGMKQFLTSWLNRATPAVQRVAAGDPF